MDTIEAVTKLSRDLATAATTMTADEARFLVDAYYQMQDDRMRSAAQQRELAKSGEPHQTIAWLAAQSSTLETSIARALDRYSAAHPVGEWARSIHGIGPVIAAGLLAHIDITKAPTAGHIWNFAGLNPGVEWKPKTKRPWNAALKTLCWKIGESFVKVSGIDDAFYGHVYAERKTIETERNLRGEFAAQAQIALERKKFRDDTDALKWYSGCLTAEAAREILSAPAEKRMGMAKKLAGEPLSGQRMLPPAHIHARSKRAAVKLFLSHLHHVWHMIEFGKEPPQPYAIAHLAHAHYIAPPNWPMKS